MTVIYFLLNNLQLVHKDGVVAILPRHLGVEWCCFFVALDLPLPLPLSYRAGANNSLSSQSCFVGADVVVDGVLCQLCVLFLALNLT